MISWTVVCSFSLHLPILCFFATLCRRFSQLYLPPIFFLPTIMSLTSRSSCLSHFCTIFLSPKDINDCLSFSSYCIASVSSKLLLFPLVFFFSFFFIFYVNAFPQMASNHDYLFICKDRGLRHWFEGMSMKDNDQAWTSQKDNLSRTFCWFFSQFQNLYIFRCLWEQCPLKRLLQCPSWRIKAWLLVLQESNGQKGLDISESDFQ